jgi:hypothetical protein
MKRDFLPYEEAEFYAWVTVFFTYLLANLSCFGISVCQTNSEQKQKSCYPTIDALLGEAGL